MMLLALACGLGRVCGMIWGARCRSTSHEIRFCVRPSLLLLSPGRQPDHLNHHPSCTRQAEDVEVAAAITAIAMGGGAGLGEVSISSNMSELTSYAARQASA